MSDAPPATAASTTTPRPRHHRRYIRYQEQSISNYIFANILRAGVVAITGFKAYSNMPDHPFYALGWLLLAGGMVLPRVDDRTEEAENK